MPVSKWEYSEDPGFNVPDVPGKTIKDIAEDYIRFFFDTHLANIEDHPHANFELRLNNKRKKLDAAQGGRGGLPVWYLLHGNLINFYRTHIPPEKHWPVMFSPYISMATALEFPGVGDLDRLVSADTGAVYRRQARINGEALTPIRITGTAANVNIPENNVLDIPRERDAMVHYDGFFVLLKPLVPPGDYLIESKGYSPNWEVDVRYSVYSRGGNFP
jgi:hypothetical protein